MPAFYFALFLDPGTVHVSERLRLLARTAAFIVGILFVVQVAPWIKSPVWSMSTFLNALATIADILLLNALCRDPRYSSEEASPISPLLYVVTKVTVIVWGVWVAFTLVRLVLTPFSHWLIRSQASRVGREGPALADMATEAAVTFLSQACLLAAPYIVYKTRVKPVATPLGTAPAFPDPQNPPLS